MNVKLWSAVAALFFLVSVSEGRWVEGTIDTDSDWTFVARFCFLSKLGALEYSFLYPVNYGTQEILLYYDEPGQWESVYKSQKNCSSRLSVLSIANNQIIALNTSYTQTSRFSGCALTTVGGEQYYNCTGGRTFRSLRERWWYIAVARCTPSFGSVSGLYLQYKLHMTNGEEGDLWHYEYSADEFYILAENMAFLLVYFFILVLSAVCAYILKGRQLFHSTYKMYLVAVFLWFFGLLLMCIAWGQYGQTGWQIKPTEVTGRLFQAASTVVFVLMLILMAKGFTITRGRLPRLAVVRLTTFLVLYILVYITLFIWEGSFFDEGLVLYFYESPPGYGLVTMRLIGWLWFLYAIFFTLKHHPKKGNFYFPFFIFYTVWFWAGPVVVLIAMFAMAKWSREKTVFGVEQFVGLCGHLFFLVLTRPSAANKNFPYHVRTSQIASLIDPDEDTPRSGASGSYRLGKEEGEAGAVPYCTEESRLSSGPNLAALFVVQDTSKTPRGAGGGGVPSAAGDGPPRPPAYNTLGLPPIRSQAPSLTLPPLTGASLPPLRGLSLPPLPAEPSAPPEEGSPVVSPPPSYSSMFVTKNH
ncbi:transmembrane protein 145-like [Babylonia areolata]|uniref:transmembrane protein 145-like n=1 Tax=Babylonia areolata TaxID=304850 RepID=UPI003FD41135